MSAAARRVLVTGAGGWIGAALARRLCALRASGEFAAERLTLVDLRLGDAAALPGVQCIEGSVGDPQVIARATADAPDLVFHLAALTSRRCEADLAAALDVNLRATVALLEALRAQGRCPAVVFTSSIAVYGAPLPASIDDATAPLPALSYGALKLAVEVLLADCSRRGAVDALALRLPGIVARPAQPGAALSAFASDLIREPACGRAVVCPVPPDATIWWLSLPRCVDALVQAARILASRRADPQAAASELPRTRALTLPALRASPVQVVDALVRRCGAGVRDLVAYAPDAALAAQFGSWPPLSTAAADRLGMHHDGDLDALIERALAPD